MAIDESHVAIIMQEFGGEDLLSRLLYVSIETRLQQVSRIPCSLYIATT
jgi:hypothetical protein